MVSSHRVSPSPCCGTGSTRSNCHSSESARETPDSFTSRPISDAISATGSAPRSSSNSYTRSASGLTFTAPVVSGGRFHPLSPRSVNTNGNAAADTTKSGRSPGPPSRFSGTAEPSPTSRATNIRAVPASAGVALSFGVPSVASTSEGAGAPSAGRAANKTRPCALSQVRALSSVSRASPAWCHACARAAAICGSCNSGAVAKTASSSLSLILVARGRTGQAHVGARSGCGVGCGWRTCVGAVNAKRAQCQFRFAERRAEYLLKNTAARSDGHAGSSWDGRFWPVPSAASPSLSAPAAC